MENLEYERSFKVEDIKPYIEYCEKNNFKKISVIKQNRVVYENKNSKNIIARITTEEVDNKKETIFDCKNVGERDKSLKVSLESMPLIITKENKDIIMSILNVLDFFETANNLRTRYVYEKNNVKFEIDNYERPIMKIIAIEGEKIAVEEIYKEIQENI